MRIWKTHLSSLYKIYRYIQNRNENEMKTETETENRIYHLASGGAYEIRKGMGALFVVVVFATHTHSQEKTNSLDSSISLMTVILNLNLSYDLHY